MIVISSVFLLDFSCTVKGYNNTTPAPECQMPESTLFILNRVTS